MRKYSRHLLWLCPLVGMVGCQETLPGVNPSDLLLEPSVVSVDNAIYLTSEAAGAVLKVVPGPRGDTAYTALEDVDVESIAIGKGLGEFFVTPDESRLLLLSHDVQGDVLAIIDTTVDCGDETLEQPACVHTIEARPLHDRLEISPDGRFALSYISEGSAQYASEDFINLNEVGVYDLEEETVSFVPLGYGPQGFAFTSTSATPRALVLTSSQVTALELEDPANWVTRELTLTTDTAVAPSQVVITGDDHFALVTIEDSPDLFTFDLTEEGLPINILSLSGSPRDMVLSPSSQETLVLTSGGNELNIVHHEDFSVDVVALEESMRSILVPQGADYSVLVNNSGSSHYIHIVDADGHVQAYLLDNPYRGVSASPGGDALAIYYVPDTYEYSNDSLSNSYAVALLNLAAGDRKANPIQVSSYPVASTFGSGSDGESAQQLFVALDGYDHGVIGRFNLATFDTAVVDIPPGPASLHMLESDDRVVVVHNAANGLISIFPQDQPEAIQFISGFMTSEIF